MALEAVVGHAKMRMDCKFRLMEARQLIFDGSGNRANFVSNQTLR